jgi:hypothetical protein
LRSNQSNSRSVFSLSVCFVDVSISFSSFFTLQLFFKRRRGAFFVSFRFQPPPKKRLDAAKGAEPFNR